MKRGLLLALLALAPQLWLSPWASAQVNPTRLRLGPPAATPQPLHLPQRRIDLDLRQADLQDVFRLLAQEGGLNLVLSPEVRGAVTLRLHQVKLQDAFHTLLKTHHLCAERVGEVILVRPAP